MVFTLALMLLLGLGAAPAAAQAVESPFDPCQLLEPFSGAEPGGAAAELEHLAEITGLRAPVSAGARRNSDDAARWRCGAIRQADPVVEIGAARLHVVAPRLASWYNGAYPDDRANGFVWAGRGLSTMVSGGVVASFGPLTAGLVPGLAHQQNSGFETRVRETPGFSVYRNPYYNGIDLPQRFGADGYWTADWGQSFARVDGFGLALGISHENIEAGPGGRNPILMGGGAPGFTHVFAGTGEPLDLRILRLDAQLVVGRVEESDYFDADASNDVNGIAMWTVAIEPGALDGLQIGFARAYMYPTSDWQGDLEALTSGFLSFGSEENLAGNELASLFARWVMPESGLAVWGEWARDDRWAGLADDFIPEPDHSQAYALGLRKLTEVGRGAVAVQAELTHLQEKQETRHGRALPVFYTHGVVRQGFTHRGQVLGASIGPGADAQYIGIDWVDEWGWAGVWFERVRRNDASQQAVLARLDWPYTHDTELSAGLRALFAWRGATVSGQLGYGYRWERDFLTEEGGVKAELELIAWPGLIRSLLPTANEPAPR